MRQYSQIKQKHADKILLFRLGDFYETFGDDAVTTAKACGITLTKRNNGGANEVPLAGFPHHQLDAYLPKLVRAGYRVAVCEQLEDPKQAKGIVKRGVVEVVTPGVVMYDKLLDSAENTYAATIVFPAKEGEPFGISVVDVSTGTFQCSDVPEHRVQNVIDSFSPAEIIFSRSEHQRVEHLLRPLDKKPALTKLDEWHFDIEHARTSLLRHFKTNSLKGYGVDDHEAGIVAAGALLNYVSETQTQPLSHITQLQTLRASEFMVLDASTRRNLEIHRSSDPRNAGALITLLDTTKSPMGARLLRWWLQAPLLQQSQIEERLNGVQSFVEHTDVLDGVQEALEQTGDIERIIGRVVSGRANAREINALGKGLEWVREIQRVLADSTTELGALAKDIHDHADSIQLISSQLQPDAPAQTGTGNMFNPGISEELDTVVDALKNGKDWIRRYQEEQRAATGIDKLKVSYNNVFGYYIEVSKVQSANVPSDYERKQTLTNSERYTTSRLKEIEQRLLSAESQVHALEAALLESLRMELTASCTLIQQTCAVIATIDCLAGFASLALEKNYTRPIINDTGSLVVEGGRHPVIEELLPVGKSYVKNSIKLDTTESQIQLITGPNMSGKSSYLRQAGIIVFMAHIGCYVPADSANIPLTDRIFTRVGAQDNITAGESTFLVEMQESANILNNATKKSLILLDEVGRGTATFDGISIAWAMAEYIHEVIGAKTLFATHYHELTELANSFERIENVQVEVVEKDDNIIFTHRVVPGSTDHSFGLHVAKMAGLPEKILLTARSVLNELEQSNHSTDGMSATVQRKQLESSGQLTMFTVKDDELRTKLKDLDVNNLTPIEALKTLVDMQGQIRE